MQTIRMNNGFIFHIGRPEIRVYSPQLNNENRTMEPLTEVEEEEEREKRRKFEELHPEEVN